MNYPYIVEVLITTNDGEIVRHNLCEVNDVSEVQKSNKMLIDSSNYCTGRDDLFMLVNYRRKPILFIDGFQVFYSEEELKLKLASNVHK